jgi:PAS domain-containing protein
MRMPGLDQWESIAIILASVVAAGPIYFRFLLPGARIIQRQTQAIATLPRLAEQVEEIRKELVTNGGSSLRDAVNRIEQASTVNAQMIKIMHAHGYFRTDSDGYVIECSNSLCKTFRRRESELMGNSWISWIAEADREEISREWHRSIRERRDFDETFRIRMDEGPDLSLRMRACRLTGREGVYIGHLSIFDR